MNVIEINKQGDFLTVIFEDNSEITMHYEIYLAASICVDDEISDEQIQELLEQEEIRKLKNSALYYLGRRAHSKKELETKLLKKDFKKHLINIGLTRLQELNYVDDQKFAELYFEEKLFKKKKGINKIIAELYQKGVSREIINDVANMYIDDDIHLENALKLAEKKITSLQRKNLEIHTLKAKLYAHLQMKGFQSDIIHNVLNQVKL